MPTVTCDQAVCMGHFCHEQEADSIRDGREAVIGAQGPASRFAFIDEVWRNRLAN
jgi:hypothetical protein